MVNLRSFAYRFSMFEHNFSRILFLSLLTTYGFFYTANTLGTNVFLIFDIALWLLYWLAHNLEKKTFAMSRSKR